MIKRFAQKTVFSIQVTERETLDVINHAFRFCTLRKNESALDLDTTFFTCTQHDELGEILGVKGTPLGASLRQADSITLSA